jgi:hypothetical protein
MIPCLYSQPNAFSKELCEQFINSFEQSQLKKDCDSRLDDGTIHKKSTDIYFQNTIQSEWYINEKELWFPLMEELNQILNKKLNEYYDLYPELNGLPPIETRK